MNRLVEAEAELEKLIARAEKRSASGLCLCLGGLDIVVLWMWIGSERECERKGAGDLLLVVEWMLN